MARLKYIVASPHRGRKRFKFTRGRLTKKLIQDDKRLDKPSLKKKPKTKDLSTNVTATKNHTTMTELPTEMLVKIFSNLDFPSQVCLGLTCKSMGSVLELVDLNFIYPPRRLYEIARQLKCAQFLKWMPKTHKDCSRCRRYIRLDGIFWKAALRRSTDEKVNKFVYWGGGGAEERNVYCPKCYETIFGPPPPCLGN